MTSDVILVDEKDREIGTMEKMEAHVTGSLHRAFSIFIFNSKHELLLQKRAAGKYHSNGLWTNTCCSHPKPDENLEESASKRLQEEMGMDVTVKPIFSFIYKAALDNNLIEHELDHVLIGYSDSDPTINTEEVSDYKWAGLDIIKKEMELYPESFTFWFQKLMIEHSSKIFNFDK